MLTLMFCKRLDWQKVADALDSAGPCSEIGMYSIWSMCWGGVDVLFGGDGLWVGDGLYLSNRRWVTRCIMQEHWTLFYLLVSNSWLLTVEGRMLSPKRPYMILLPCTRGLDIAKKVTVKKNSVTKVSRYIINVARQSQVVSRLRWG
jgi:hypothetical protein